MIEKGIKNSVKIKVTESDTAKQAGSGDLEVFATPKMVALMEEASYKCIAPYLEEGSSSVGTLMNVKHLCATPVGMEVTAECEVVEIDGRRVVFSVRAYDEKGLIGEGTHERFIVYKDKFVAKTCAKLG